MYSICISKQIRYNLESEKYTICIVQDNVGELVMSSGPLWNFWIGGNCLGMILLLLAPFQVLTCGRSLHITCIIQSTGYLQQLWYFLSDGMFFLCQQLRQNPWKASSTIDNSDLIGWQVFNLGKSQHDAGDANRSRWWMQTVLLYCPLE